MPRDSGGFTVMEALVAMILAAILCTAYMGVLRQNALFARDAEAVIGNILLAQEYLADNPISVRQETTPGWVTWENDADREVNLQATSGKHCSFYELGTRVDGLSLTWTWAIPQ